MNGRYLRVAIALIVGFFSVSWNSLSEIQTNARSWPTSVIVVQVIKLLLSAYLISRCTEVLCAFYKDASDKLRPATPSKSLLGWGERVQLALRSYLELILNFALLYAMLPASMWEEGYRPGLLTDALSYSATTITTSGGGGFVASHWFLQALTAYEIACGLILLVVSFTVYVGHGLAAVQASDAAEFPSDTVAQLQDPPDRPGTPSR